MNLRRTFLGIAAAAFAVVALAGAQFVAAAATPAVAAERYDFDAAAFADAQAAGKPILVEIWASWCPTCRAQQPILEELTSRPKFDDMVVFRVDFDTQKDVVRDLGAFSQSTLIVYSGAEEVGRSVADTNADSIAALLDAAI